MFLKRIKSQKVSGYIHYFQIDDFWLNKINEVQRDEVRHRWSLGINVNPDSLDKSNIKSTSMSKSSFLILMAEGIKDIKTKEYLLNWAFEEQEDAVLDKHFNFIRIADEYKQMIKEDRKYYANQIKILQLDCETFDSFCVEYKEQPYYNSTEGLPNYPAFRELAIAYERTGEINKAIEIAQIAIDKSVNEKTSFHRRIEKLQKKIK